MATLQPQQRARRALGPKSASLDENATRQQLQNGKKTVLSTKTNVAGARRALGDLSNVARPNVAPVKEASKPAPTVKPKGPVQATKHQKSLSTSNVHALARAPPTQPLRPSLDVVPNAPKMRQIPFEGAIDYASQAIEASKSLQRMQVAASSEADLQDATMHDASTILPSPPVVGLGIQEEVDEVEEDAETDASEEDDDMDEDSPDNWLLMDFESAKEQQDIIARIKTEFEDEPDVWDPTMVAEYSEEILKYMSELEVQTMPKPHYMEFQGEIDWEHRATLVEWLMQTHMRYHLLPETLWIAINIMDRFLSKRNVSLVKLQLVGMTAMFLAAKYEEIMAPSVDEFVTLCDNHFSREEILKGERIMLSTLEFNISSYCNPYTWLRRISKADDYDIQTRTLSKFIMDLTLLDHRFLRARPSMIAAIGMYTSRKMLGGAWGEEFIYYSGFTEVELETPLQFIKERLVDPNLTDSFVYRKYSTKKFLKASVFAVQWAESQLQ